MRIGFDVTPLLVPRSGVGRYTSQLLAGLRTHAPENEYTLLAPRPPLDLDGLNGVAGHASDDGRVDVPEFPGWPGFRIKTIWMQLVLPLWLRRAGCHACHFTNYLAPVAAPCPSVVTFHDMSLFLLPDSYSRWQVAAVRPWLPLVARRASALITVSESARRDLLRILPVPPERVHVVHEAAAPHFRPIEDQAHLSAVAERYRLAPGFLLYVGTIEPRKNLGRLIEALHTLHRAGLRRPLVIAGRLGWKYEGLLARIEALGLREAIRFTGYVPDADLPALFNLASVFVFPSIYEGFGLPILEAMASGTPVVTAKIPSTAEVAGEAALLVDPRSSSELADAIAAVLGDANLRQRLSAAGRARAAEFSWERAARETAAIYEAVRGVTPAGAARHP